MAAVATCHALVKTCSPSFHEKGISGGDEITMRWEYCTKMIFGADALAEWNSIATYYHPDMFRALFNTYKKDQDDESPDSKNYLDPKKHLITVDLAIYDEVQWQKIMHDVERSKLKREA